MNDPPPADIWLAIAKEWYWIVIFLALVLVAFAPTFLKMRCPSCRKRKLNSVELPENASPELANLKEQFVTFFDCGSCQGRFKRLRSGPLEDASAAEYEAIFHGADARHSH